MDRPHAPAARLRLAALGALIALAVPACASHRESVPPGEVDASVVAEAPKSSPPMGYPWAAGASLPTASARAPGVAR